MEQRMTRSLCVLAALTLFSEFLVGCDSVRKSFGGGKNAPDEFVVYKRPPLSLPPEYGLRPPAPGESRPQKVSPMDQAREAILGKNAARTAASPTTVKAGSPGLQALITRTGANKAEPGIRRLVNQESSVLADEDQIFVNKLIFWVDDKSNPGIVVDAKKEQKRIMSNQALGKPINEGEIPEVKRKKARKGLLDF
jgi:hypothetical protein